MSQSCGICELFPQSVSWWSIGLVIFFLIIAVIIIREVTKENPVTGNPI